MVVHGADGLDELTTTDVTYVAAWTMVSSPARR